MAAASDHLEPIARAVVPYGQLVPAHRVEEHAARAAAVEEHRELALAALGQHVTHTRAACSASSEAPESLGDAGVGALDLGHALGAVAVVAPKVRAVLVQQRAREAARTHSS